LEAMDLRHQLIEEIKCLPEDRLGPILDLVHFFRVGLESSSSGRSSVMDYAGCWRDMPDEVFQAFHDDIEQRRRSAFATRHR